MAERALVVAAFEPFAGRRRNRAEDAVAHLEGAVVNGHRIEVARLPTAFARLPEALARLLASDPVALVLVGESASARKLLVERLAVNVAHARFADNAGLHPIDEEVLPGGEAARRVAFDPRLPVNAALAAGVPCEVSSHAGTFCCNAALYLALGMAAARSRTRVAFVHVPARWPWARDRRASRGIRAIASAVVAESGTSY